jgi:hypothetical protein
VEEDNPRREGAGRDEFEVHVALPPGVEGGAAADQDRVDPGAVLVDQADGGVARFGAPPGGG